VLLDLPLQSAKKKKKEGKKKEIANCVEIAATKKKGEKDLITYCGPVTRKKGKKGGGTSLRPRPL